MSLNLPPSPPQCDHPGGEQTVNTQQTVSTVTFGIDSHDELNTTKKHLDLLIFVPPWIVVVVAPRRQLMM